MWFPVLITLLVGYFLGNLNGAVLISRLVVHDDVRTHGSGNAGLTNFIRSYGVQKALLVIGIDGGKAVLACLAGGLIMGMQNLEIQGMALGGAASIVGHVFPALLDFKGGKGILSGFFVALTVDWRIALLALAVFSAAYLATRYVSLGSVLSAVAFAAGFVFWHYAQPTVAVCGVFMAVLAIFMHKDNIRRLLRGQERKTDLFGKGSK